MVNLTKNPLMVGFLRMVETSAIVSLLAFLGTLPPALQSVAGIQSYDWRNALASLALGIVSGTVNGAIATLNLLNQQSPKGP